MPWELQNIWDNVKKVVINLEFVHIFKESNLAANLLAKKELAQVQQMLLIFTKVHGGFPQNNHTSVALDLAEFVLNTDFLYKSNFQYCPCPGYGYVVTQLYKGVLCYNLQGICLACAQDLSYCTYCEFKYNYALGAFTKKKNIFLKMKRKILATRLADLMPKLISEEQGAFISGRKYRKNICLLLKS